MLKIVVPKGELFSPTCDYLDRCGLDIATLAEDSRRLRLRTEAGDLEYIIARPSDIPTFVEYGAADVGFVGKDVLMECGNRVVELLDLGYGKCRFVLAAPNADRSISDDTYKRLGEIRVATKYPLVTERYFKKRGLQVEIITLRGSVELAPLTGLAEWIFDLSATGRTLKENDLAVLEEGEESTARLIANYVSLRLKAQEIEDLRDKLGAQAQTGGG